ncbi:hypothetical protein [Moorena sp. SIO3H5]|uniref:hypothetical protein n=1 Tax=Moorena sp. SIO3H5 TaxID=2607834 RepID=UPI0013BAE291|nr:hypothetical protein [Moorena sp. SIO3H5]NEO71425.1 hypothetical protein [Moorena sp. SIO3H5]
MRSRVWPEHALLLNRARCLVRAATRLAVGHAKSDRISAEALRDSRSVIFAHATRLAVGHAKSDARYEPLRERTISEIAEILDSDRIPPSG